MYLFPRSAKGTTCSRAEPKSTASARFRRFHQTCPPLRPSGQVVRPPRRPHGDRLAPSTYPKQTCCVDEHVDAIAPALVLSLLAWGGPESRQMGHQAWTSRGFIRRRPVLTTPVLTARVTSRKQKRISGFEPLERAARLRGFRSPRIKLCTIGKCSSVSEQETTCSKCHPLVGLR